MFGDKDCLCGENADPDNLKKFNSIPGVSWFKKSVWENIGGFTWDKAEDWDFWLRAYKAGYKFQYFPEVVYNFNKRKDSVSSSWVGEKFEEIKRELLQRNNESINIDSDESKPVFEWVHRVSGESNI
jgi:GT2 family glycosyltransferase